MTEQELQQYLIKQYPKEDEGCEWKEFKNLKNDFSGHEKDDVISYVSALANMEGGQLVVGVEDKTLRIVGTDTYNYDVQKARLHPLHAPAVPLRRQCRDDRHCGLLSLSRRRAHRPGRRPGLTHSRFLVLYWRKQGFSGGLPGKKAGGESAVEVVASGVGVDVQYFTTEIQTGGNA